MQIDYNCTYRLDTSSVANVLMAKLKLLGPVLSYACSETVQLTVLRRVLTAQVKDGQVRLSCSGHGSHVHYLLATAGKALVNTFGGRLCLEAGLRSV